ncbi:hypothetical protein ACIOMM_20305 [Streptomyces sp. NPDC087908]|uniref:hypothetical protein n=1 Tax=Streptomyces sp. NPDC087908 TaxID=3365820 RepID=UPI00382D27AD
MNALWVEPATPDYDSARATFSWRRERSRLAERPGGGNNVLSEAVDRHLHEGRGEREALRLGTSPPARTGVTVKRDQATALVRQAVERVVPGADLTGLDPGVSLRDTVEKEIARTLSQHQMTAVPVVDGGGRALGVVSEGWTSAADCPSGA